MKRIDYLFTKYLEDKCSKNELLELLDFINDSNNEIDMKKVLAQSLVEESSIMESDELKFQRIYQQISSKIAVEDSTSRTNIKTKLLWYTSIAASLLLISLGVYVYLFNSSPIGNDNVSQAVFDVNPGKNLATIVFEDGKEIHLSDDKRVISYEGNMLASAKEGELTYINKNDLGINYNTVKVPAAGKYHVTLSDGTKVWLNSVSSLKFPTNFESSENRVVELNGEGYFEVSKSSKPFIVICNGFKVNVLGTKFNINTYEDDGFFRTTLVEGSVLIYTEKGKANYLKPNQQSLFDYRSNSVRIKEASLEEALAWKNNDFVFTHLPITTVMNQLSRWYDVDIIYEGEINKDLRIGGLISRTNSLQSVMKALQLTKKISLTLKDNTLYVRKK